MQETDDPPHRHRDDRNFNFHLHNTFYKSFKVPAIAVSEFWILCKPSGNQAELHSTGLAQIPPRHSPNPGSRPAAQRGKAQPSQCIKSG